MQETIKKFIELVKKESQQIIDCCQDEKSKSEVFNQPLSFLASISEVDRKKIVRKLRAQHGIYIFILVKDLYITMEQMLEWNNVKGAHINFSRNPMDIDAKEKDFFYIGSCCSQSLMSRIRIHFSAETTSTSLKLNHDKRKWAKSSLKVYCFPIKSTFSEEEMRIILPAIERNLHNKMKAIAVSCRV